MMMMTKNRMMEKKMMIIRKMSFVRNSQKDETDMAAGLQNE
jgi:hypothetical protein